MSEHLAAGELELMIEAPGSTPVTGQLGEVLEDLRVKARRSRWDPDLRLVVGRSGEPAVYHLGEGLKLGVSHRRGLLLRPLSP
jgi:hypothetical protein